jgi:hypothetical protein
LRHFINSIRPLILFEMILCRSKFITVAMDGILINRIENEFFLRSTLRYTH